MLPNNIIYIQKHYQPTSTEQCDTAMYTCRCTILPESQYGRTTIVKVNHIF